MIFVGAEILQPLRLLRNPSGSLSDRAHLVIPRRIDMRADVNDGDGR
ncbi:hypothetical protein [Antarctobacter sp.]